jgi:formylmethanofuran--tetrahydromethanopterin N-formyltransferase
MIDDTYAEAFDGTFSRLLITAEDEKRLSKAAICSTALPLTVLGGSEGGIEKWIGRKETLDGRKGAVIQIWVTGKGRKARERLEEETAKRIRQGILVVPTTSVFNFLESEEKIDLMEKVGHCGDGYESELYLHGKKLISIPIMMGDFLLERFIGFSTGIMGGNIWLLCDSIQTALKAGDLAVDAVAKVDGAITSFDICSAGSKPTCRYENIGPSTNHPFCPTLREKLGNESKVPYGVKCIPEIVINGISLESVKEAMKSVVDAVKDVEGIIRISAGNYGGKLGRYKIWLREL